jgi:hypothetical protein
MKQIFILFTIIFAASSLNAQSPQDTSGTVNVIYCTHFEISKPLSELATFLPENNDTTATTKPEAFDKVARKLHVVPYNPDALPNGDDTEFQDFFGTKSAPAPLINFAGMTGDYTPPDPSGAAGSGHYVQAVNSSYKIFSKSGTALSGNISLIDLFGNDEGDPIVLYDKYVDRFVITEFSPTNKFYIAVSKTSDPTGQYYIYQYTSPDFPDYPKYSIWADGYYMTSNQYSQVVFVFERDKMIIGDASARCIYKSFSPPMNNSDFFCPSTADADGQLPPFGTPCPIFCIEDDNDGGTADRINIYDMAVSWGTTPSATITLNTQLPVTAFNSLGTMDDVTQPGTSQKLDALSQIFMFRAQYRIWPGYNTIVLNHAVKISAGKYAIRWYELRQVGSTWSVYQQNTYNPDALSRWCGSIAMDDNGSIAMAYSVTGTVNSTSVYPSIRYTARNASDTLNLMTFAEETAIAGTAPKTSDDRWGDYSQTSIDPSDGTVFWFTGEYTTNGNPDATRIFSFQIPDLHSGIETETEDLLFFNAYQLDDALTIHVSNLPSDKETVVDLFDITGKKLDGKTVTPVDKSFETVFSLSGIPKGTYLVRVGVNNSSFQKVKKVIIL